MSLPVSRTLWEEGREPGREMVALGVALALTVAAIDVLLTDRVGVLFDLGFVLVATGLALAVRLTDVFTVGVLPPLLMLATFLLLAMSQAEAIARPDESVIGAVVDGLSHHWVALVLANLGCLGVLWMRLHVQELRGLAGARPEEPRDEASRRTTRTGRDRRLPA